MFLRVACLLFVAAVAFTEGKSSPSVAELETQVSQCCVSFNQVKANTEAIEELTEKLDELPDIIQSVEILRAEIEQLRKQVQDFASAATTAEKNSQSVATFAEQVAGLAIKVNDEIQSSAEKFKDIQEDLAEVSQQQGDKEERLKTVLSIDRSEYDVSDLYKGHLYIASKDEHSFNLHDTNEECKANGGYLVEFDDADEIKFVRDFMSDAGHGNYYTGANDADKEGTFVYYNSGKPVVNLDWKSGEPNDAGGNEDCVEIQQSGFNDHKCDRNVRYMCEIDLF